MAGLGGLSLHFRSELPLQLRTRNICIIIFTLAARIAGICVNITIVFIGFGKMGSGSQDFQSAIVSTVRQLHLRHTKFEKIFFRKILF